MSTFTTAAKVLQCIRQGDAVEAVRATNRAKINNAANCFPPLDEDEARKMGLKISVNWGELMECLAEGRRQYRSAFRADEHFFRVKIPLAPPEHQSEWELFITDKINTDMRESVEYFELQESKWAAVVTHGIAPCFWYNEDSWLPEFVAIADLRIPTDTTLDFKNLDWFAVRQRYTPLSLLREVCDRDPHQRWDHNAVWTILKNYKEVNATDATNNYEADTSIEKLYGLLKQNGGMTDSDAVPTIPLWHFFFKDTDGKWYLRIVPESSTVHGSETKFLYENKAPFAEKWQHMLHCQFGDLNNDAPFTYPAIRSLGFALLEPCFYTNLARCKLLQHIFDQFNIWLRSTDSTDRARSSIQSFQNLSVLRQGLSVVPQAERHQVDANLVEMGLNELKQLQQRASSSYTQQTDSGARKEQTAFETSVKVQQVNAMTSGLLVKAFIYEGAKYREICRRYCRQGSSDDQVKDFQKAASEFNIPQAWLDVTKWKIEPVTPLGMGNPSVALSMAKQLLEIRPLFDPTAQQEILHDATIIITQDARKAARWAPIGKKRGVTNGQSDVQGKFATLMLGINLQPAEGFPAAEQAESAIGMLAMKVGQCKQRDNMATVDEAIGFQAVAKFITALIQRLAGDPQEKERAKQYSDVLGQQMNEVKGMAQRWMEQQQKQQSNGNIDPATMAKIQALMMTTQAKLKAKAMAEQQKLQQNESRFYHEQRRADAETYHEMDRDKTANDAKNRMTSTME